MPSTRLNSVIQKLVDGELIVMSPPVMNGDIHGAQRFGDSDFDLVWFEMEHVGFDFLALQSSLAALLNRARIAKDGLSPSVAPFVRIPPTGRETSEWIIKQALDSGVYGLLVPTLETPEEAIKVVDASRYPVRRDSANGGGRRGVSPHVASRYWGLTDKEYVERADLWPQNPDGEILLIGLIETVAGVENLEKILDATDGFGAIWAGLIDLSADMGLLGQPQHPEVEEKLQQVLNVCRARNVPCIAAAFTLESALERVRQGFQIVCTAPIPGIEAALRAAYAERE